MVDMQFVDSSNIEAIGYDDAQSELHVRFKTGQTYVYPGVPRQVYDEFCVADSKGRYFSQNIKTVYTNFFKF